jgi:hypothetical protein
MGRLGFLGFVLGGGVIYLFLEPRSSGFFQELVAGYPESGQMLRAGWHNFLNAFRIAVNARTAFFFAMVRLWCWTIG